MQQKILLGQLGRNGDCLYATAIARQIKQDYPGCHLTWAISSLCKSIIENHPYVDAIWEIPLSNNKYMKETWQRFEQEARQKKETGEYDEVFLTQTHPGNFQNYDGTVRSSLFRGYPHPITVPVTPILRLSEAEISAALKFITTHNISEHDIVVLFECSSTSGQGYLTPEIALDVAQRVLKRDKNIKFILASNLKISTSNPNIVDGSVLGFKEFAEITKYCTLLVGCSSGISWLTTSDWSKPLPKIQVLSSNTHMYASMMHDARYFGLSTDQILEMQNCSPDHLAMCILCTLKDGFSIAQKRFHREIPIRFDFYMQQIHAELLSNNQLLKTVQSFVAARERFKNHHEKVDELNSIITEIFFPYINILWNDFDIQGRNAIAAYMGYNEPVHFQTVFKIKNILLLAFRSLGINYRTIARRFFMDIIQRKFFSHTLRLV